MILTSIVVQEVVQRLWGNAISALDVGGDAGKGWAELLDCTIFCGLQAERLVFVLRGDIEGVRIQDELPSKRVVKAVVVGACFDFSHLCDISPCLLMGEAEPQTEIFPKEIGALVFHISGN